MLDHLKEVCQGVDFLTILMMKKDLSELANDLLTLHQNGVNLLVR